MLEATFSEYLVWQFSSYFYISEKGEQKLINIDLSLQCLCFKSYKIQLNARYNNTKITAFLTDKSISLFQFPSLRKSVKNGPGKNGAQKIATWKIKTRETVPKENCPSENCHPENCPPGKLLPGKLTLMKIFCEFFFHL